ncbi:MAG: ammonia-forming cytochrome c nitrite reductase [Mangrovibacterium sp.]
MTKSNQQKLGKGKLITLFAVCFIAVFLLGMLAASITERRSEAVSTFLQNKVVDIQGIEPDNALWGENYPREYETWAKTADMDFESQHLGNKPQDELAKRPDMVILWAGYAFSKEYNAPRGHFYAVDDVRQILRTAAPSGDEDGPMPAACWTCKSPDVPRLMNEVGINEFYNHKWAKWGSEIMNPIGCADCHDPVTMALQISRPALIEAFARQGKDITKATHQEMRSLVCAQCHVEYYFTKQGNVVTFPWDKGFTVEDMERYYDEIEFSDWTHQLSRTPMIKAQHPDYETFTMGPHAERGLSCADCHMPYMADGSIKFTDHQIMSPLKNIKRTCQTCHNDSEDELKQMVYTRQNKAFELRDRLEELLSDAHLEAAFAWENGATEAQMEEALKYIRQAQWRWDFGVASHGASFHAPQETQRILAHGIDKAHQARQALNNVFYALHIQDKYERPQYASKEEAQKLIGLDMKQISAEKEQFLQTRVPAWIQAKL